MTVFIGWLADKTRHRGLCNMSMICFAIIGFSMLLGSKNPHVQYAGTFLGAVGIYRKRTHRIIVPLRLLTRDPSYHPEQPELGSKQHRRLLQAWCSSRHHMRLGKHER